MKYKPHDYQTYATNFILTHPISAVLLDMGLGKSVITLTASTKLSRPAISHHLKVLKDCGLIKARKDGTHNFYYVDINEHIERLKKFLHSAENFSKIIH